jgi:microcystin-dependent protein
MSSKKNILNGQAEMDLLDNICANIKLNESKPKKSSNCVKSKKEKVVCKSSDDESRCSDIESNSDCETTTTECHTIIKRGCRGKRGKKGFPGYYLPNGVILLWYGNENTIPMGWVICDGRTVNGRTTPDLRGRFVLGYATEGETGANYPLDFPAEYGETGGEQYHALTLDELPSHNHGNTGNGATGNYPDLIKGITGAHIHTAEAGDTGEHTHDLNDLGHNHMMSTEIVQSGTGSTVANNDEKLPEQLAGETSITGITIKIAGNHTHPITVGQAGDHYHPVTLTSVGDNEPHNNMPPFYVLIYIMKAFDF